MPRRLGELLIDHTFSPGISPEDLHAAGLPGPPSMAVGKDRKAEFATATCNHCSAVVILNPLRTRDRTYCPHCDQYLCDACARAMAVTGKCISIDRLFDFVQDQNAKLEAQGVRIIGCLPDLSPLFTTVTVSAPKPQTRE